MLVLIVNPFSCYKGCITEKIQNGVVLKFRILRFEIFCVDRHLA